MDKARVNTALELLREAFPGHKGRKGKRGGSMPKSAGLGARLGALLGRGPLAGGESKKGDFEAKHPRKPTRGKRAEAPPAKTASMRPSYSLTAKVSAKTSRVGLGKPYSKAEQGVGSLDVAAGKSGRVTGASFSNFLVKNLGGKSRSSGSYRTLQLPEKDRGKAEKLLKSIGFEFASTESRPGESQRTKVFRHKQTGIRVSTAIFRGETLLSFSSADITGKMKSPKGS